MSRAKPLPEFSIMGRLKAFYTELSAPRRPYFKTLVKVFLKNGFYLDSVVHTSEDHIKLEKRGHRGARRVEVLTITDPLSGESIPRSFTEYTCGSLYAPTSTLSYSVIGDQEWALVFKIDCDLARSKTGEIEDAISHYISDRVVTGDVQLRRRVLENYSAKGHRAKSNTQDMLERYGRRNKGGRWDIRDKTTSWILNNRAELDAGSASFRSDQYRDEALRRSSPLSNRDFNRK